MKVNYLLLIVTALLGSAQLSAQTLPIRTSISQSGDSQIRMTSFQESIPDQEQAVPLFKGGLEDEEVTPEPEKAIIKPVPRPKAVVVPKPQIEPQVDPVPDSAPAELPTPNKPAPAFDAPLYNPPPAMGRSCPLNCNSGAASCGIDPSCGVGPGCGIEPSCGSELSCGCGQRSYGMARGSGLLAQLFPANEPNCGCESTCGMDPYGDACGCGADYFAGDCNTGCDSGCAGGCNSGCNGGSQGCWGLSPNGRYFAGAGIYYVQPYWETNPSFSVSTGAVSSARQFDWDVQIMPVIYGGYEGNNGFGWQARYVYLDETQTDRLTLGAGQFAISPGMGGVFAGPGQTMNTSHSLKFQFADLEFTQSARAGIWGMKGTLGGRYLSVEQRYQARSSNGQTTLSQHGFEGYGPTVSMDVSRYVGAWKLFGTLRQALLFGDRDSRVSANGFLTTENNLAVVSMTELETGLRREFMVGGYCPFAEAAVVGQYLTGVGNGNNSNQFSAQRDQAMGFFGGRLTVGLNF